MFSPKAFEALERDVASLASAVHQVADAVSTANSRITAVAGRFDAALTSLASDVAANRQNLERLESAITELSIGITDHHDRLVARVRILENNAPI